MQKESDTKTNSNEQRKLAAVMFADMTGYTAMMQEDETHAKLLRNRQKHTLDSLIPAHNGTILQYFGDGTLSIFDSASDAVRCGIAIQNELQKEPRVKLRIGIHSGDVVYDMEGIYGGCVNIASRIETLSVPGAVLFSATVYDEIKNQRDIKTKPLGKFHLKNVKRPVEVYAAANEGMVIPLPDEISGKTSSENISFITLFKKKSIRIIASILAAVILTLTILLLYQLPGKISGIDSIAVLPLENISGNAEQEYFVSGMHETLISELSKISSLKIISRTSTMQFKNTKKPIPQIAKELDVKAIIEGSVIREGDIVRITVQLIDGKTDKHIWSKEFNKELKSILELYGEVAKQIAGEIKITLTPQDQMRLVSDRAVNPRAYEFFLTGRHFWNQRTIQAYQQSIDSYKKSLELDSTYAPAYAAIAESYVLLGEQGGISRKEARQLADSAIQTALRLNENLAEAQTSLGIWKLYYEWNWKEAEKAFRRAIELNPGNAPTYLWYGRSLGFIGRYDEALTLLAKGKELDPLSPILAAFTSQIYIFSKQYDKAIDVLQDALRIHPNHALIMHNLGELYLAQNRYTEAIAPLKQSAEKSGTFHFKAILGYAYALAGRTEEARKILADLNTPNDPQLISGFNLACIYLALGEKGQALNQLEKGYEYHDAWLNEIKAWPWFDPFQNEPRYQELIRKMNFPQ